MYGGIASVNGGECRWEERVQSLCSQFLGLCNFFDESCLVRYRPCEGVSSFVDVYCLVGS